MALDINSKVKITVKKLEAVLPVAQCPVNGITGTIIGVEVYCGEFFFRVKYDTPFQVKGEGIRDGAMFFESELEEVDTPTKL